ncbi:hypothetical protein ACOALZ_15325 [Nocardiopsis algeriensis]|uniref:hypothetical protein n=1 Tax=Nocardiopsis algeriensis TaxID=1478215 RepID=UPI003B42AAB8
MNVRLEYDLTLAPSTRVDEIVGQVRKGLLAHRVDPGADLGMSYRSGTGETGTTVALSVDMDLEAFGFDVRGAAGLAAVLSGTSFRDPGIRGITLSGFGISRRTPYFPGPRLGLDLLGPGNPEPPWLSVPVPKSVAGRSWARVARSLVGSGVRVLTDLSLFLTDEQVAARARAVADAVGDGPAVALFLNATGRLEYASRLAERVSTLQPSHPRVVMGLRVCPASMGFSVLEYLRSWEVPLFAYTLSTYPSGRMNWSQAAYAAMVNCIGADVVNVGLLSVSAFREGTLYETMMPLLNGGTEGRASLPALTGGVEPRVAYEYTSALHDPFLLHTMTPVFRGGTEHKDISRRVKAILEAVEAARGAADVADLFAGRSPRIRNWQALEEADPPGPS